VYSIRLEHDYIAIYSDENVSNFPTSKLGPAVTS
jgi:hypothetical protein